MRKTGWLYMEIAEIVHINKQVNMANICDTWLTLCHLYNFWHCRGFFFKFNEKSSSKDSAMVGDREAYFERTHQGGCDVGILRL